jgi:nicotinamide-nucleotide amidase
LNLSVIQLKPQCDTPHVAKFGLRPVDASRSPAIRESSNLRPVRFTLIGVNAEIVAIGSEMLTPFRQDTNSLFLTRRLNELGVEVIFKTIVGDSRDHLLQACRIALSRAEIVIFSGGLGPTEDDLTRECVAQALGLELCRDHEAVAAMYARAATMRLRIAENNVKQADRISGAELLANSRGTAPGQWLETTCQGRHRLLILLPGPPHELEGMFDDLCFERLRRLVPEEHLATCELKVAMVAESAADLRAAKIYKQFPEIDTTVLAKPGEVQFHLKARGATKHEAEARVEKLAAMLEDEFADEIFSSGGETLEQIVGYFLQMRRATLSVAESCTGGLLAERITRISGSSRYFMGGALVYSNEAKTDFCGVPPLLLASEGAVSSPVAAALAEGIRERLNTTLGIGITGVAGPGGGSEEKPVGLVYVALADASETQVVERRFNGDRRRIRWFATQLALDMLRRRLR